MVGCRHAADARSRLDHADGWRWIWTAPRAEPVFAARAEVAKPSKTAEHFPSAPPRHALRSGWAIQVGAYEDEGEAKQHLSSAKSKGAQALQKADAYIERTVKGAKTYYRARFAGGGRLYGR